MTKKLTVIQNEASKPENSVPDAVLQAKLDAQWTQLCDGLNGREDLFSKESHQRNVRENPVTWPYR